MHVTLKPAAAGIAAPILFIVLVVVQELLQPGYSRIALPISALGAWPLGWIQNINFIVYSLLLVIFVIALDHQVAPSPWGRLGVVLLMLSAMGAFMAGEFPWRMVDGRPMATVEHVIGAIVHFVGSALGLVVFSRRMAKDAAWRDLAGYALVSGLVMLGLFAITTLYAVGPGRPLHPWAGLVQRATVLVWFSGVFVLALRLERLSEVH